MLTRVIAGTVILMCGALAACQTPAHPVNGVVTVEIPTATGDDAKKADAHSHPVELAVGDRLVVRLGAHGATGYIWQLAGPAPAVMDATGPAQTEPSGTAAGADTWTTYRFQAICQGRGDARFILRRPWTNAEPEERVVNVPITVKPAETEKK